MKLKLERPLAFMDIESTGLNTQTDRVIELAVCKVTPDHSRITNTWLINPETLIPSEATTVHGINNEDAADCPVFRDVAYEIYNLLNGCDIGGFNSNSYDVPLLFNEFIRTGIYWDYTSFRMIDVGNIYKRKEPRTLSAAHQFYCGTDLENAHSAEADIIATVNVFAGQLEKYGDLPMDLDSLQYYCNYDRKVLDLSGKFTLDADGDIVFNFGTKKGTKAKNDLGYVSWMYSRDFNPDTKKICEELLGIS